MKPFSIRTTLPRCVYRRVSLVSQGEDDSIAGQARRISAFFERQNNKPHSVLGTPPPPSDEEDSDDTL